MNDILNLENEHEILPEGITLFRDEEVISISKVSVAAIWVGGVTFIMLTIVPVVWFVLSPWTHATFGQFHARGGIYSLNFYNYSFLIFLVAIVTVHFHKLYFKLLKWRNILTNKRLIMIEPGVYMNENYIVDLEKISDLSLSSGPITNYTDTINIDFRVYGSDDAKTLAYLTNKDFFNQFVEAVEAAKKKN